MSVHAGGSILLVDDECEVLESFELILNSGGFRHTIACLDSRDVFPIVKSTPVDVVLLDLTMPHLSGQELLTAFAQKYPEIPVIVVTATDDLETAVECMKYGAFDYIVKPVEKMRLISGVRRAMERQGLARENRALKHRLLSSHIEHSEAFEGIITRNSAMISLFQYIEAIAPSPEPVLITGETGVGKELVAKAIHRISGLEGAFVAVNVAGLDDTAFSDTLFGHKKNAFTGAASSREGLVREAAGGTLFLDEVGDLQNGSQIKLLRLLQEHEFYPLGSDVPCLSSARIMAATNRDVEIPSAQGGMRRDLFYRLQTHMIRVPPLRERMEDVPLLVDHFMEKAALKLGKTAPGYPDELLTLLQTYHFPGNVRELETMIFDAVSRHKSHILSLDTFTSRILGGMDAEKRMTTKTGDRNDSVFSSMKVLPTIREAGQQLIAEALKRSNGNQSIAARLLGITQPALSRRLNRPGRD